MIFFKQVLGKGYVPSKMQSQVSELPVELLGNIAKFLPPKDLARFARANKNINEAVQPILSQQELVTIRVPAYLSLLLENNVFPEIAEVFIPQDFVRYVQMRNPLYSQAFFLSRRYISMLYNNDQSQMNIWEDLLLPKGWSCEHKFREGRYISKYVLSKPWENTEDNYQIIYKLNEKPIFSVSVYKFKESGWDFVDLKIEKILD